MHSKKLNFRDTERYRYLFNALQLDGKQIESLTKDTVGMIEHMLDDDLFNPASLNVVQTLARESVVNVPTLVDTKIDNNDSSTKSHLVIKSNERIEMLVNRVKHQAFLFLENAEKIRCLVELNLMNQNIISYEVRCSRKNEIIEMQGNISANQMDIMNYYRNRSEIGVRLLKQPSVSDYWQQLVEIDEDIFFKIRMILFNLRLFNLRLDDIVSHWTNCST